MELGQIIIHLLYFTKMMHVLALNYLLNLVSPIVSQATNYAMLLEMQTIFKIHMNSNLLSGSFFTSTNITWDNKAREMSSVLTFKQEQAIVSTFTVM